MSARGGSLDSSDDDNDASIAALLARRRTLDEMPPTHTESDELDTADFEADIAAEVCVRVCVCVVLCSSLHCCVCVIVPCVDE
jgi:hypothetical protein